MRKSISILSVTFAVLAMTAFSVQCFCPAVSVKVVDATCHAEQSSSCCCSTDVEQSTATSSLPFVGSTQEVPNGPSLLLMPERVGALALHIQTVLPRSIAVSAGRNASLLYLSHQAFLI